VQTLVAQQQAVETAAQESLLQLLALVLTVLEAAVEVQVVLAAVEQVRLVVETVEHLLQVRLMVPLTQAVAVAVLDHRQMEQQAAQASSS
jgi:hypothetical protein